MNYSDIEISAREVSLSSFVTRLMNLMPQLCRAMIRHERNSITRGDLALPQLWALEILAERGARPMHDLVADLQLKPSTGTQFVDRLVEMGLAKRERDARDRRAVRVDITSRGHSALQRIERQRRKASMRVFKIFTPGERGAYLILIEKLVSGLNTAPNPRGKK